MRFTGFSGTPLNDVPSYGQSVSCSPLNEMVWSPVGGVVADSSLTIDGAVAVAVAPGPSTSEALLTAASLEQPARARIPTRDAKQRSTFKGEPGRRWIRLMASSCRAEARVRPGAIPQGWR